MTSASRRPPPISSARESTATVPAGPIPRAARSPTVSAKATSASCRWRTRCSTTSAPSPRPARGRDLVALPRRGRVGRTEEGPGAAGVAGAGRVDAGRVDEGDRPEARRGPVDAQRVHAVDAGSPEVDHERAPPVHDGQLCEAACRCGARRRSGRRARLVGRHHPGALGGPGGRDLLADQGVEQRGLARLEGAGQGDAQRAVEPVAVRAEHLGGRAGPRRRPRVPGRGRPGCGPRARSRGLPAALEEVVDPGELRAHLLRARRRRTSTSSCGRRWRPRRPRRRRSRPGRRGR